VCATIICQGEGSWWFRIYRRLYRNWLQRLARLLKLTMSEPMPLNAGVLIIGSLLWDEKRQAWRRARLDMTSVQTVTAPIRYGRLSPSRGNTYTMVFSRRGASGHAKVVSCSQSVSSFEDLNTEAECLWKAEYRKAKSGSIAEDWGCVALLCNPERKIPKNLLTRWADRVGREAGYGQVSQTQEEGDLITKHGLLQIAWPRFVEGGEPVQLDLLLATANDPTLETPTSYPTVETITKAWNMAAGKHVKYFWTNLDNGIRTFQDNEIQRLLRRRAKAHA
jgi:hypothetical protein